MTVTPTAARAISSAGEHCLHTAGVTGSIPVSPTTHRPQNHWPVQPLDEPPQDRRLRRRYTSGTHQQRAPRRPAAPRRRRGRRRTGRRRRSSVIAADACPSIRCTAFTFAPAADREARRGVPQLVRGESGLTDRRRRRGRTTRVGRCGCAVTSPSGDVNTRSRRRPVPARCDVELVDEEPGERHRPALMRLRRAPHEPAAVDLGHRLGDVEPPPHEVDRPTRSAASSDHRSPQYASTSTASRYCA